MPLAHLHFVLRRKLRTLRATWDRGGLSRVLAVSHEITWRSLSPWVNAVVAVTRLLTYNLLIELLLASKAVPSLKPLFMHLSIEPGEVVSIEKYTKTEPSAAVVLYSCTAKLAYAVPRFDSRMSGAAELIEAREYVQYFAILRNVSFFGESNILSVKNNAVIYDMRLLDPDSRYRYTDHAFRYCRGSNIVNKSGIVAKVFDKAIMMSGNYSFNYYHWMYEFIIKWERSVAFGIPIGTPILADHRCLQVPQLRELLTYIVNDDREIVSVDRDCRYYVRELYYGNCTNIIPPNLVNERKYRPEDVLFDVSALMKLRSQLLPHASHREFPRRCFISRKNASGARPYNEDQVFAVMADFGFVPVFPEGLTVADQMALFSQAECIAGGSGAAFTNLLFCHAGCRAIVFVKSRLPISVFSTIACAAGVDLLYVTEEATMGDTMKSIHDAFEIDVHRLRRLLADWQLER